MKLLIISHTPHYLKNDSIVGWGSTIREIDQLATLFEKVTHLAPLHPGTAPNSSLPYTAKNVQYAPVNPAGGANFKEKLGILWRIPHWLVKMKQQMIHADVVHIRCPASISLVALFAARLWARGKPTWVKYAGDWQPMSNEPFSYTFQRWWLNHNFHKGIVTINSHYKNQPLNVITFTNPSLSTQECEQANKDARNKHLDEPLNILFVGRIEEAKGAGRVIEIAEQLKSKNIHFIINMIGDGPHKENYKKIIRKRKYRKAETDLFSK